MRAKSGFTLVEILIVVVILGILAAIVIPQFTNASEDAKESALVTDLQTARSQIELYKIQHTDVLPLPESGGATWNRMTTYTDVGGVAQAASDTTHCYGPYLQKVPTNQFNNKSAIEVGTGSAAGGTTYGWYLNSSTGAFQANDSDPNHRSL
jgi:general secretion pathway protein G